MKKLILILLLASVCLGDVYTSHQKPKEDSLLDIGTSSLLWRYIYCNAITDNTATWSNNNLSGFTNGIFRGTVQAEQITSTDDIDANGTIIGSTLTDSIFFVNGGIVSGGTWQADTIEVPYGGTGATSLADGGLLVGSGTSAITALPAASNGQLPIGSTGNDPVMATLTEGSLIDITNSAGSITIAGDESGLDGLYLRINGGNNPTANIDWGGFDITNIDEAHVNTSAVIGTMTISSGSITDSTGAISFGNEDLTTTGALKAGSGSFNGGVVVGGYGYTLTYLDHKGFTLAGIGGHDRWYAGSTPSIMGYTYTGTHQKFVWDSGVADSSTDTGNAWVSFVTGDASFAETTLTQLITTQIGTSSDKDLLEIADDFLTINGEVFVTGSVFTVGGIAVRVDSTYAAFVESANGEREFVWNTTNGQQEMKDGVKLVFGDTDTDLQIYSDGTNGVINVATALRLGSPTTDYVEIKSNGETELHGDARVIKYVWIGANGIKAPGSKPATFVEDGLTGCWEFADAIEANQESISGTVKVPCDIDRSVAPTFGIGWHATGVSPGDCKWQFEYLYMSPNDDATAAAQETLTAVSTASATSEGLTVVEIAGIDLPSSTDVAMFWRITRLSGDAQDTITDVVHIRGNYFKYTSNKQGELL